MRPKETFVYQKRTLWVLMCLVEAGKQEGKETDYGRGGVACIAKKGLATEGMETQCDDLLWVSIGDLHLGVAYFVPATSPFAERNEKRMEELQANILTLKQVGQLVFSQTPMPG